MNKRGESNTGVGFFGVLLAVFVALKLAKVITWSWWLVLSPLWVELGLVLLILLVLWMNDYYMFLNFKFRVHNSDEIVERLINMDYVFGVAPNEIESGSILVFEEGEDMKVMDSYESIKERLNAN